jgi:hypothetical protein
VRASKEPSVPPKVWLSAVAARPLPEPKETVAFQGPAPGTARPKPSGPFQVKGTHYEALAQRCD